MVQTYKFIKSALMNFIDVNILVPFPGTRFWAYAVEKGLLPTSVDWSSFDVRKYPDHRNPDLFSRTRSVEQMRTIYRKFRRYTAYRNARTLLKSPWLDELPLVVMKRVRERVLS
jgi:hypothetical protein